MSENRLKVVSEEQESGNAGHAASMLMLALRALSQRALVAASTLFTLIALASACWLWLTVLPDPTVNQLVGVALYGLLIVAVEIIRRRS